MGKVTTIVFLLFLGLLFVAAPKTTHDLTSDGTPDYACKDCNVILITLTNLSYDHLSQNGYSRPTSPNLDALSKESIVFDNAFSHSSWTLPESISLYTSLYPFQHKVMNRYSGSALAEDIPIFLDVLNDNGYSTAAFTGGFDYNPVFGLTNRFSEYEECAEGSEQVDDYGKLTCAVPRALDWIKNNLDKKFFVHAQGYDTHCPFSRAKGSLYDKDYKGTVDYSKCLWTFDKTEPQVIDGKTYYPVYSPTTEGKASVLLGEDDIHHLVALYDETIALSDEAIGSFLDEIKNMGLWDNTIIIFTSEHGDMFGKNGRFMRGGPLRGTFYDDVLHIPLLIKHPKITPARLDGLVEHIDIAPTLLDFLSLPKPSSFQGESLTPLIMRNKEVRDYVFAGSEYKPGEGNLYFADNTRVEAIRGKQFKLIKEIITTSDPPAETLEFYDIINDREELHNLAGVIQGRQSAFKKFLEDLGLDLIFVSQEERIFYDLESRLSRWSESIRKGNQ